VKALVGLDGKKHNYPSLLAAINELDQEITASGKARGLFPPMVGNKSPILYAFVR